MAVLPKASRARAVTAKATPAVAVALAVSCKRAPSPALTAMPVWPPESRVAVSVAVTVWVPTVLRMTAPVNTCTPASAAVKV